VKTSIEVYVHTRCDRKGYVNTCQELHKFAFLVLKDDENIAKSFVEEWLKVLYKKDPSATFRSALSPLRHRIAKTSKQRTPVCISIHRSS
jgi:hypothetical protein